jgi:hypothetical protein
MHTSPHISRLEQTEDACLPQLRLRQKQQAGRHTCHTGSSSLRTARTCVHSDRQYDRLRYPSLNTTISFLQASHTSGGESSGNGSC